MPTGPSDSPASDQSLSPEQRERRMLAWTRWILALCLLVAGATLLRLVATVIRYAFGFDIVMRLPLAFFGFLILFAALFLALLTAAVRNRPSWPIALWGVRIFMVGVYALFLPAIGVAILA